MNKSNQKNLASIKARFEDLATRHQPRFAKNEFLMMPVSVITETLWVIKRLEDTLAGREESEEPVEQLVEA